MKGNVKRGSRNAKPEIAKNSALRLVIQSLVIGYSVSGVFLLDLTTKLMVMRIITSDNNTILL